MAPVFVMLANKLDGRLLDVRKHRIRHGIRHTEALAGRRHRPHVPNERLRYMLISPAGEQDRAARP